MAYAGTRLILLYLAFEAGNPNNYVPVERLSLLACAAVRARSSLCLPAFCSGSLRRGRPRTRIRSRRCAGGIASVSGAWFVGAEVASDWAGRDVDCSVCRPRLCWARVCATWNTRISDLPPRAAISRGSTPRWVMTSPNKWSKGSGEIDDRLRQIPGVRMVAPVLYAPMLGG